MVALAHYRCIDFCSLYFVVCVAGSGGCADRFNK